MANLNYTVENNTILKFIESGFYVFEVPDYITELYQFSFSKSSSTLTTVKFLGTKVVHIGLYCFSDCNKLVNIDLRQCPNLETVDAFVFVGISATNLYFPPKSTVSYGGYQLSLISEFIVPKNHSEYISEDGIVYSNDKQILYAYPPNKQNDSFEIPSTVKTIYHLAFATAKFVKTIKLPSQLSNLWGFCFSGTGLVDILIPGSVKTISECVFSGCQSLKTVQLQCNISSIEKYTFNNCKNLQSIVIIGEPTISDHAFDGCSSLCEIFALESVKEKILYQISHLHCKRLVINKIHIFDVNSYLLHY